MYFMDLGFSFNLSFHHILYSAPTKHRFYALFAQVATFLHVILTTAEIVYPVLVILM
jgi:hypothetical protein